MRPTGPTARHGQQVSNIVTDPSPTPPKSRRPWRFWELALMLLSSAAIVALFGLALTRDRTRVESFWTAATAQALAIASAQEEAEELAAVANAPTVQPTAPPSALRSEPAGNAPGMAGTVPSSSGGTQVALVGGATREAARSRSTTTPPTEPTEHSPDVTASPQGNVTEGAAVPAVSAAAEDAGFSDSAEDVEVAVAEDARAKSTADDGSKETGDSTAVVAAAAESAAPDGDAPFRLPTPTPARTLVAALATAPGPTPDIGDAVSITFPITGTGEITLSTPTPEIGEPVSITFPVTGTASVTTATPTPEIGEPISITFPITQAAAVVTPTTAAPQTPTPTPTATPQPTASATATPLPTPTPSVCPDGRGGALAAGAKFYAGPLAAYDQAARMAVTLVVDNVPPGEVGTDRLNLYLSDRAQFMRIVEEAEQPRENHIEAGVRSSAATTALTAAIGRPVGEFFVTIVNDTGTDATFCLTIENGAFQ
jgi:hypothetical protein